jgi:MFS family permease
LVVHRRFGLCGLARSITELIVFRGLQGLGAGGLMVLAQTAIADLVPPRQRGRYQDLFTGVFALCSVAGPVLGGVITDALSWRWIFYVNLPVGAVALSLILLALPRSERPRGHRPAAPASPYAPTRSARAPNGALSRRPPCRPGTARATGGRG